MTAASILFKAQDLIRNPKRWTQEAVARDKFGNEVSPLDDKASRFDMIGAIQRQNPPADEYGSVINCLRRACGGLSPYEFNDGHGHKAVMKAFGRASDYLIPPNPGRWRRRSHERVPI